MLTLVPGHHNEHRLLCVSCAVYCCVAFSIRVYVVYHANVDIATKKYFDGLSNTTP